MTANCLHPGVIDTRLLRAYTSEGGALPVQGARVEVYLATFREAAGVNGGYFEATRWARPSSLALDPGIDLAGTEEWCRPPGKVYVG